MRRLGVWKQLAEGLLENITWGIHLPHNLTTPGFSLALYLALALILLSMRQIG